MCRQMSLISTIVCISVYKEAIQKLKITLAESLILHTERLEV